MKYYQGRKDIFDLDKYSTVFVNQWNNIIDKAGFDANKLILKQENPSFIGQVNIERICNALARYIRTYIFDISVDDQDHDSEDLSNVLNQNQNYLFRCTTGHIKFGPVGKIMVLRACSSFEPQNGDF